MKLVTRKEFVSMLNHKLETDEYSNRLSKNYSYWDLYWLIKAIYECMGDVLKDGNKLYVSGCFTLQPRYRKPKRPGNYTETIISGRYYPYFKPLKAWKQICLELRKEDVQEETLKRKRKNGKDSK